MGYSWFNRDVTPGLIVLGGLQGASECMIPWVLKHDLPILSMKITCAKVNTRFTCLSQGTLVYIPRLYSHHCHYLPMLYPKNGWMTIVSQNVIKEELEEPPFGFCQNDSNFWSRTIVALQLKSVCHDHGSSMEKYWFTGMVLAPCWTLRARVTQ